METSLSSSELQAYYDDIDWDAFNDPRMDDATIENDLPCGSSSHSSRLRRCAGALPP